MNQEIVMYFMLADPDTVKTCLDCYKNNLVRGQHAAAECAYIVEHRALPEWGYVVESFEVFDDDSFLFIHADLDGAS